MSTRRRNIPHDESMANSPRVPSRDDFGAEDVVPLRATMRFMELRHAVARATVVNPERIVPAGLQGDVVPAAGPDLIAFALLFQRPALLVRNGKFDVPSRGEWSERLPSARRRLERVLPSVGRVEPAAGERNGGTAWRLGERHVLTAKHVVEAMERRREDMAVDFVEEYGRDPNVEFPVRRVEPRSTSIDIAALELAPGDAPLPPPLVLSSRPPRKGQAIAAIGFPSWADSKNPPHLFHDMFADILEVKRLQPGFVTDVEGEVFSHDCSTLDGNSGGPVVDLATGEVIGLHTSANFGVRGCAVRSDVVLQQARKWGIVP